MAEQHDNDDKRLPRDDTGPRASSTPSNGMTRALGVMRHVWAVDHAVRHLSRAMEQHLGVTGPQRMVIRFVGANPGIAAGALASLLSIDASTLTGHLQKLEDDGMLERRTSAKDGRRVLVHLTAKGKRLDVMTPGTVEAAVDSLLADTDANGVATVESFLARLVKQIDAQSKLVTPPKSASSKSAKTKASGKAKTTSTRAKSKRPRRRS